MTSKPRLRNFTLLKQTVEVTSYGSVVITRLWKHKDYRSPISQVITHSGIGYTSVRWMRGGASASLRYWLAAFRKEEFQKIHSA